MEPVSVKIALQDESHGYAISPKRVPLALLNEFTSDVQAFIRGSEKEVDTAELDVAVKEGSLALEIPTIYAPRLQQDIQFLRYSFDLSKVDAKRRAIMERWQAGAKNSLSRVIRIATSAFEQVILIDRTTDFRAAEIENWVDVERYIKGELMDLGGMKQSNAHIKLPDGKTLTVRANKDLIKSTQDNLVYRTVHLRISAKYNLDTGELRDASLIEFVNYAPKFDAKEFDQLTLAGAQAWKEVEDPALWVRQLRGLNE
jgi:hypothetical protein